MCASSYKKRSIDALRFIEAPAARADPGARAERRPGQEPTVVRLDAHRFAGIAAALGDGGIEHPGVTAQQRLFFARLESEDLHFARTLACARGCAAS